MVGDAAAHQVLNEGHQAVRPAALAQAATPDSVQTRLWVASAYEGPGECSFCGLRYREDGADWVLVRCQPDKLVGSLPAVDSLVDCEGILESWSLDGSGLGAIIRARELSPAAPDHSADGLDAASTATFLSVQLTVICQSSLVPGLSSSLTFLADSGRAPLSAAIPAHAVDLAFRAREQVYPGARLRLHGDLWPPISPASAHGRVILTDLQPV